MQTIFKNEEKVSTQEVLEKFTKTLQESYTVEQSEADALTNIVAKNPTDIFTISEMPTEFMRQGDILIWYETTDEYKENISRVQDLQNTERLVLQEGDSITGDHRVIPIPSAKYTMKTGKFVPAIIQDIAWGRNTWDCKILEIDSPFVLYHREHGNMTFLTPGKYMFCSQLDSETLERMKD